MKQLIRIFTALAIYLVCQPVFGQDIETRIADLLAQMPASSFEYRDRLAEETYILGRAGLEKVCSMVVPPGQVDDSRARFAIESLSKYLSREKPSGRTREWEAVCIEYATRSIDRQVQSFFMSQLQWIGSSATVDALAPYISDEFLCHPAISAMKAADPEKAGEIFVSKLGTLSGNPKIETIRVLGELKMTGAIRMLEDMLEQEYDTDMQRNILRALALIGDPDSQKALSNAARVTKYMPEPTGATMALLEYAKELGKNGYVTISDEICLRVMKKCRSAPQIHYKSYALKLYADNAGISDALPVLTGAMKNKHKGYRMAAIQYAIVNSSPAGPWANLLVKTRDPEVQAEIIYLLGSLREGSALPILRIYMDHQDAVVRTEAVRAIALIEGSDALDRITAHMFRYPAEPDLSAVKEAILTVADTEKNGPLSGKIPGAPDPVKAVILEILAEKGDPGFFSVIMENARGKNSEVRYAAIRGLKSVATGENLISLLDFLAEGHDSLATAEIQLAIVSAVKMSGDRDDHVEVVLSAMEKEEDKLIYIPILAGIGGYKSLNALKSIYDNSAGALGESVLQALVRWPDDGVIPILFEVCKSSGSETAFNGYVWKINRSGHTADQKLLLLRKIMPLAAGDDQMNMVISACGNIKTLPGLMFVSRFIEEEQLRQNAARTAVQIAQPVPGQNDGLYGDLVREALIRAMEIIEDTESPDIINDIETYLREMPDDRGFVPIFNGKDLSGWQGLVGNPITRAKMDKEELQQKQDSANALMHQNWKVRNGMLVYTGNGFDNICTVKEYGDFELIADWKIEKEGDSGIYLRGSPQVQIWDTSRVEARTKVGSGGLFNNKENPSIPLDVADNSVPDWNTFRITMIGERVTVHLNGVRVVDNVIMENYWDRSIPIFPFGPIELQAHTTECAFRDIYVREIHVAELDSEEKAEGFEMIFNGRDLDGWTGNKINHVVEDGAIAVRPELGGHGNLYTEKEYANYVLRLDFKLTPGANNGLGIRAPLEGNAAYQGMELQVLDNGAPRYANLKPWQYHGSVYGVIPARRGYLRPVGEWNEQEVIVDGTKIRVILNGTTIVDGDIADAIRNGTPDGRDHPGLNRKSGHIGFLGHGSVLWYRNIRIKEL